VISTAAFGGTSDIDQDAESDTQRGPSAVTAPVESLECRLIGTPLPSCSEPVRALGIQAAECTTPSIVKTTFKALAERSLKIENSSGQTGTARNLNTVAKLTRIETVN
jgi:hypothetical protein